VRIRLSLLLVVGVLVGGLAAPTVAAGPLPSGLGTMAATSFSAVGDGPVEGWYWMRSANYADSGTWRFENFDRDLLTSSQPLYLFITPLVTQGASGGAGWNARIRVKVTLTCPTSTGTLIDSKITTMNPFPLKTTASTGGVGYQNFASVTVSKSKFKCDNGLLKVVITRDPTYKSSGYRPHVAVQEAAVTAYWFKAP
jgi:hypothetical protein